MLRGRLFYDAGMDYWFLHTGDAVLNVSDFIYFIVGFRSSFPDDKKRFGKGEVVEISFKVEGYSLWRVTRGSKELK